MPVTLKKLMLDEAREVPELFPIRGVSEVVSMNVVDHVPLLILRSRSIITQDDIPVEDVIYSLYTSRHTREVGRDDEPITSDTEWVSAGVIEFQETQEIVYLLPSAGGAASTQKPEYSDAGMAVVLADLQPYLQGRGIGKYIYKAALNDLLDLGYGTRYSDEHRSRSVHAERVWESLARGNPERVTYIIPGKFGRWKVRGYVQRRPVRVRRHRRRA